MIHKNFVFRIRTETRYAIDPKDNCFQAKLLGLCTLWISQFPNTPFSPKTYVDQLIYRYRVLENDT